MVVFEDNSFGIDYKKEAIFQFTHFIIKKTIETFRIVINNH